MTPAQLAARHVSGNPLHPYRWEARYRDGGRLQQFDVDGYHPGRDIDQARLATLVVHGHPAGPLVIDRPARLDAPVTDVVLRARVSMTLPGDTRTVVRAFGFAHAGSWYGLTIDDDGRVSPCAWREGP
jgi:hypothetical protein